MAKPEIWNGMEKNVLLPVVFIFYNQYLDVLIPVLQVIPLLLQVVNRIQGVRSMAQASGDSAALDEAKRQAKRQKARRT